MAAVRSHQVGSLHQTQIRPNFVDFTIGQPNPQHLRGVLQSLGAGAAQASAGCAGGDACFDSGAPGADLSALHPLGLQYGCKTGDPNFLRDLAAFLTEHYGMESPVTPDELMLTNGNSHAIGFVLRCLGVAQGDVVVMDDPTYFLVADIVRACGATIKLVPMLADGLDVASLERVLGEQPPRVKALYLAGPCHHNPTGAVTSPAKAQRIIDLAQEHNFFIVADEPYALMGFGDAAGSTTLKRHEGSPGGGGEAPSPARPSSRVISLGTFSKILGPGLRLGWLHACPALVSRLFAADPVVSSGGGFNPFVAHMVHKLLFTPPGKMSALVADLNTCAAAKAGALRRAFAREFQEAVEVAEPRGGYFLWCRFTGRLPSAGGLLGGRLGAGATFETDAGDFRGWLLEAERKERFGVCFLHGDRCKAGDEGLPAGRFRRHFRCSWAFFDEAELEEGVRRLRCAWEAYVEEKCGEQ